MNYDLAPVSGGVIVGMVFTLIISVGLPVALCIIAKKKLRAKFSPVFIGAATFLLAVLVLESLAHNVILSSAVGEKIMANTWLYAVYGGAMAALFEESARFIAMKLCMKKYLTRENAVMYGIGHGGIESVALVGITYISNVAVVIMINSGAMNTTLAAMDTAAADALMQQLSSVYTTAPALFFAAGMERISAIVLHICLSCFVYRAVRYGDRRYIALALLVHFAVDAVVVILNDYINMIALEVALLLCVTALTIFAARLYHRAPQDNYHTERATNKGN